MLHIKYTTEKQFLSENCIYIHDITAIGLRILFHL